MFEASPRTARHRGARFLTAVDVVRKPCGDATAGNHSEAGEEMESDGTSRRESLECRSRREPMQFGSDARGKRNTRCEGRRWSGLAAQCISLKIGDAFSPPESGGQRGTKCRARGGSQANTDRYGFGTTPRTISTSSRSCCPPDSGGLKSPPNFQTETPPQVGLAHAFVIKQATVPIMDVPLQIVDRAIGCTL